MFRFLVFNSRKELPLDLLRLPVQIFYRLLFPAGSQWNDIARDAVKIFNQPLTVIATLQMFIQVVEIFAAQCPSREQSAELNVPGMLIALERFVIGRR